MLLLKNPEHPKNTILTRALNKYFLTTDHRMSRFRSAFPSSGRRKPCTECRAADRLLNGRKLAPAPAVNYSPLFYSPLPTGRLITGLTPWEELLVALPSATAAAADDANGLNAIIYF